MVILWVGNAVAIHVDEMLGSTPTRLKEFGDSR
jgi:hypothetical protein